jgi:DNA primase
LQEIPSSIFSDAKYVNSPETPIFHKGAILFGLDHARKNVGETIPFLMVEGQMDCLRCHENSFTNAVASQGTAITAQHVHLLHRYAVEVICLLDGDRAGRDASMRLIPLLLKEGMNCRFVSLPASEDPDIFLLKNGANTLKEQLRSARSIVQTLVDYHMAEASMSFAHRAGALRRIFTIIRAAESRVVELDLLRQLSLVTGVGFSEMQRDYFRLPGESPVAKRNSPKGPRISAIRNATEHLLRLLIYGEEFRMEIAQIIEDQWVDSSTIEGRLLNHVIGELLNESDMETILAALPLADQTFISSLLFSGTEAKISHEEVNSCLTVVHASYIKKCIGEINHALGRADASQEKILIERRMKMKRALLHPPRIGNMENLPN